MNKLLFETHLLRLAFGTMSAVREATAATVARALDALVRGQLKVANEVAAVGIQPGKVVGWILSEEEHGARVKH